MGGIRACHPHTPYPKARLGQKKALATRAPRLVTPNVMLMLEGAAGRGSPRPPPAPEALGPPPISPPRAQTNPAPPWRLQAEAARAHTRPQTPSCLPPSCGRPGLRGLHPPKCSWACRPGLCGEPRAAADSPAGPRHPLPTQVRCHPACVPPPRAAGAHAVAKVSKHTP